VPGIGGVTSDTTWLDSDSFIVAGFDTGTGDIFQVDIDGAGNLSSTLVASNVFGGFIGGSSKFTTTAYEPALSPYLFVGGSEFTGGTTVNKIVVLDPSAGFTTVAGPFDFSDLTNGFNTMRELHLDANGHLIVGTFAGSTAAPDADILEAIVNGATPSLLADNSNVSSVFKRGSISTAFSGHDVATTLIDWADTGSTPKLGDIDTTQNYFGPTTPKAIIRNKLLTGFNGGTWDGEEGINIVGVPTENYAIGYSIEADPDAVGFDIRFAYTRAGDITLDFTVNFNDLLILQQNYGATDAGWTEGDVTYDGNVNFNDLLVISQNYGFSALEAYNQLVELGHHDFAADWLAAVSLVPEPTTLALVAGAGLLVLRRR
jgi:hypothetical protein